MKVSTSINDVLLRNSNNFEQRRILFAGNIKSDLPASLVCTESRAHTLFYHHWLSLSQLLGKRARFSLVAKQSDIANCDTLIYYWPKNKREAKFQLMNLLSLLPLGSNIFVIGEGRSGVRGAEQILESWSPIHKIDSARHCRLYCGRLQKQPDFIIEKFWKEYLLDGLIIKTLPGVFSYDGLDMGSQLLASTLKSYTRGKVLNISCGTGVLAAVLASCSPKVCLTLCDVSASAIEASRATLAANRLLGTVFASNVFSDIVGSYDLIISNPPFHNGIKTSLEVAQKIIHGAALHLNNGGELRIVANAFLPYPKVLSETFSFHEVITQNNRFKVYSAIL